MTYKIIILWIVAFFPVWAFGQGAKERLAYKNVHRGKWEKSYGQLQKVLTKDNNGIAANYVMAEYFFAAGNPGFNLDSASRFLNISLLNYGKSSTNSRDRLSRFPVDSTILVEFRQQIDSAAFDRAYRLAKEKDYSDFLLHFPQAAQSGYAVQLRDKAAYDAALQLNTYEAFDDFLKKYPESEQAADATEKSALLKFNALTKDKRLTSYERYLKDHPFSSYRKLAEQNIFEIRTASGTIDSYNEFLKTCKESYFTGRAQGILFHLLSEEQVENHFDEFFGNDSLRSFIKYDHHYIVPFLHEGKFGFMDQDGRRVIHPEEGEVNDVYKCGNINDDVIVLSQKLVAFNGALISDRTVESVDDIGFGFLIIDANGCSRVIHKSGFEVGDTCITSAKLLNGKFLALQKDNLWSIWTLTGKILLPYTWDAVAAYKDVIVVRANDKHALVSVQGLAGLADQNHLDMVESVDAVKPWRNDLIWVKKGDLEGLVNQALDTVLHAGIQSLQQTYFGTAATDANGIRVINDAGHESICLESIQSNEPWTAVKVTKRWHLFDPLTNQHHGVGYDSIFFVGPFAIALRKDSLRVYFKPGKLLNFKQPVRIEFVPGLGSSSFLILERAGKKSLYTREGKKLFTASYDKIQYAGEGFFMVHKKEKKGLISSAGKLVLPIEFDAIGTVDHGVVSLLKAMKFGLYHCERKKLIKTQYDKNLSTYNEEVVIAYRDGHYGFVGWDNKPIGKIEFNEVKYWNDSAAFVRKDLEWSIYEIASQAILMDEVRHYTLIQDGNSKLAIVQQGHNYGVIHNQKGTLIPVSFSDIVNVGSRDTPLYFTEKHVEEASIFVVIYFDARGNMLRKEVYENDDYERIYCSDN